MGLALHDVYILTAVEDSATKMLLRNWVAQCKCGSGSLAEVGGHYRHLRSDPISGLAWDMAARQLRAVNRRRAISGC